MRNLIFAALIIFALPVLALASDVYRYRLGDFELIAMIDRDMTVAPSLIMHENKDRLKGVSFTDDWNKGSLSYFILKTGNHTILFDAGISPETTKNMLAMAKVKPDEIDIVCLTHMHPDHVGGMVHVGERVFKNARVYVSNDEASYWEAQGDNYDIQSLFRLYRANMTRFIENTTIIPGVQAMAAYGHTPGHTVYKITSRGKTLVIWGDTVHIQGQFHDPGTYLSYDLLPKRAAASRKILMEDIASNGYYVAGMHMRSPALGKLKAKKDFGYEFIPLKGGEL